MSEGLSIVDSEKEINLETNKEDLMALFLKSLFGIVPFGSPIGETISAVIPHQKLDRLIDFVQILNYKLKNAERKIEEHELKTAEFTDLLEDAYLQASRALSKERLEYIASLLKNSLTDEEVEHLGKKKLLSLLGELNDAEIILLKYHTFRKWWREQKEYLEFFEKHKKLLAPFEERETWTPEGWGLLRWDSQDKALLKSYQQNLLRLGLIVEKFNRARNKEIPKFDERTGKLFSNSNDETTLGIMLLKYINQFPEVSDT